MTEGGDGGDTSKSPNFIKAIKEYHANQPRERYATYGMLDKKQTQTAKDKISKNSSKSLLISA